MICQWLDVYRNGVLLTNTIGLRNGDILTVTVRTDRRPGYTFIGWVDENGQPLDPYPTEVIGTEYPTFVFTITCDSYINARFRRDVVENVSIETEPDDENYGSTTGDSTVPVGTSVTITAIPIECKSIFDRWIEKVSGEFASTDNPYTFTATEDMVYEAVFRPIEYTVTVTSNNTSYGTVSISGYPFELGDVATLTATPQEHYVFEGWYKDNVLLSTNNPFQYTISQGDNDCETIRNIEGRFYPEDTFLVSVSFDTDEVDTNNVQII